MVQWLWALAALPENLNLLPTIHLGSTKPSETPAPGDPVPSLTSNVTCTHVTFTCTHKDIILLKRRHCLGLMKWLSELEYLCLHEDPISNSQNSQVKCQPWPKVPVTPTFYWVKLGGNGSLGAIQSSRYDSFWFSERPKLKAIRHRVTEKDTQCPPLASACISANSHSHTLYTHAHRQWEEGIWF